MAGFPGWDSLLLQRLGAPATAGNLKFVRAWQQAEGGNAAFNPLNTTQSAVGATSYNSNGGNPVKNYTNAMQGINATVATLLNGHYNPIVGGLRSGKASPQTLASAVADSPWGTGSGVLKVLGSGHVSDSLSSAPPLSSAGLGSIGSGALMPSASSQLMRQQLIQNMMQGATDTISGHMGNANASGSLMALAMLRNQMNAAQQRYGTTYTNPNTPQQSHGPIGAGGFTNPYPADAPIGRVDQGVDYSRAYKGPVFAIGNGVVTKVDTRGWDGGGAVYYKLDKPITVNGHTYTHAYTAEAGQYNVQPGQRVAAGQPIAYTKSGWQESGFASPNGGPLAPLIGGLGAGTKPTTPGNDFLALTRNG